MKPLVKLFLIGLLALLMGGWGTNRLLAATASPTANKQQAAIQAIQQAPDPSAALEAYANGLPAGRNDPQFYAAFVGRMVDLRLPELAYHQAQTLTRLDPKNGLGWGVQAYVEAHHGHMTRAISAINKAAQFAPDNKFVQRAAGTILAWYDLKADKPKLSDSAKAALAGTRSQLDSHAAFSSAYNSAKRAYRARSARRALEAARAAGVYMAVPPLMPYPYAYNGYPYYYNNLSPWGPGWAAPNPWWWQPYSPWYGFNLYPGYPFTVFNNPEFFERHEFFEHQPFEGGEHFEHERPFEHHEFGERGELPEGHESFEH